MNELGAASVCAAKTHAQKKSMGHPQSQKPQFANGTILRY